MSNPAWEIINDLTEWLNGTILTEHKQHQFCNEGSVRTGGGCAKYLESAASQNSQAEQHFACRRACAQLRGDEVRTDLRNHGMQYRNPYGILEKWKRDQTTCGDCQHRKGCRDFHPSPCFGYVFPEDTDPVQVEKAGTRRSFDLCPYAQIRGSNNPTRFLQCYLSRDKFFRYQTDELGLFLMALVYARPGRDFIYATKSWETRIVLRNARCHGLGDKLHWFPDDREQLLTYVFQHLRDIQREIDPTPPKFVRLLTTGQDRLTPEERELPCVYCPDGEISAFLLGWRLRKVLGPNGFESLPDWIARGALPQDMREEHTYETELERRLDETGLRDLIVPEVHKLLFDVEHRRTLYEEFCGLGLCESSQTSSAPTAYVGTERLYRLVRWLEQEVCSANSLRPFLGAGAAAALPWLDLEKVGDARTRLGELSRQLSSPELEEGVALSDIHWLCSLLVSRRESARSFSTRAISPLIGQYICRFGDTSARSWVALPTRVRVGDSFEPFGASTPGVVGYAILHIKDSAPDGRPLDWPQLEAKLRDFRPVLDIVARVEDEMFLEQHLRQNPRERAYGGTLRHVVRNIAEYLGELPPSEATEYLRHDLWFATAIANRSGTESFDEDLHLGRIVDFLENSSGAKAVVRVVDSAKAHHSDKVKEAVWGILSELMYNGTKHGHKVDGTRYLDVTVAVDRWRMITTVRNRLKPWSKPDFAKLNDAERPEPPGAQGKGAYLAMFAVRRLGGEIHFSPAHHPDGARDFVVRLKVPITRGAAR